MAMVRCPLVSFVALVVYLAASVAARGLHHHVEPPSSLNAGCGAGSHFGVCPRAGAEDSDHACPVCCGLHLAQVLPTAVHAEAVTDHTGEAVTRAAVSCPHSMKTASHSRGPPAR